MLNTALNAVTRPQPVGGQFRPHSVEREPEASAAPRLQAPGHAWIIPSNDEKVERSVVYMKTHLSEPLTAKKIAAVAHVSCSHFFVLFKRRMQKSPIEYFIILRMEEGARLLEYTRMAIKDVALAVGYKDPFYFSRLFKLAYKIPPTGYRLAAQQARSGNGYGAAAGLRHDRQVTERSTVS
ncbi:MAG TPA: AraC family transcriptional regulator [Verrucomicrobiae bacterium]|jgi:transcriptional regulator GlxA family with amidase domain|nr:AraC family transcriptional regulator [Verrucomicrobiae bacterium]